MLQQMIFHYFFFSKNSESLMHALNTREFISKRNMNLESFRILGASKIIIDNEWKRTICDVKDFVPRIVM